MTVTGSDALCWGVSAKESPGGTIALPGPGDEGVDAAVARERALDMVSERDQANKYVHTVLARELPYLFLWQVGARHAQHQSVGGVSALWWCWVDLATFRMREVER